MFEKFSDESRATVVRAKDVAQEFLHPFIGTEHLLLGIIHGDNSARVALGLLGVQEGELSAHITSFFGTGFSQPAAHTPFTVGCTRALNYARREMVSMEQRSITPEHLLLGLLREDDNGGAMILRRLEIDPVELKDVMIAAMVQLSTSMDWTPPFCVRPRPDALSRFALDSMSGGS